MSRKKKIYFRGQRVMVTEDFLVVFAYFCVLKILLKYYADLLNFCAELHSYGKVTIVFWFAFRASG